MDSATNFLITGAGVVLLLVVFYEIYATILRSAKYPGLISDFLNRNLWQLATRLTRNHSRKTRHRILSSIGPLLMPLFITIIVLMLVTGFALIYLPRMETAFFIREEAQSPTLFRAFYFSGVTLLTIGYGDILPTDNIIRFVALIEGACGIGVISLGITYLLTIYSAQERKRALALNFFHQARQGVDIPGFISRRFTRGRFRGLTETLRDAARDLEELLESHIEHPVINYFHSTEVYKGMPRTLFFVLETCAIINAHLDEDEYIEAADHPDVLLADDNARYVLGELITALNLEKRAVEKFETEEKSVQRRRKTFRRALKHLQDKKIKTRADIERAFQKYSDDREDWERQLYHLADFLGYDWDEVTGDHSLEDAIDHEVVERHEILIPDREEKEKGDAKKPD
jgi:hypothetical protein